MADPSSDQSGKPAGDAFREYVEPEIEVLLRVARTITGSAADAEDLVQETLVRAYRAMHQFDGRYPRAWLLTILRRTNVNLHRRQRPGLVEDWAAVQDARPAFANPHVATPEQDVMDRVLDVELDQAVRDLDPRYRTVLLLVGVDGLTYAETAEVLGVPVGTVMSRLSRARTRVRAGLKDSNTGAGRSW